MLGVGGWDPEEVRISGVEHEGRGCWDSQPVGLLSTFIRSLQEVGLIVVWGC